MKCVLWPKGYSSSLRMKVHPTGKQVNNHNKGESSAEKYERKKFHMSPNPTSCRFALIQKPDLNNDTQPALSLFLPVSSFHELLVVVWCLAYTTLSFLYSMGWLEADALHHFFFYYIVPDINYWSWPSARSMWFMTTNTLFPLWNLGASLYEALVQGIIDFIII